MPELYNTSFMNNATNPLKILVGVGNSIGNQYLFGNLLLLSFFLIFMILAFREDWMTVLLIDSFITTIIAILLAFAGLVSIVTVSIPAVLFFIVLVFYLMS